MKKYFPFIGIVVVASSICYLSSCGGDAKPLVKEDVNLTFRRTIDSKDTEVTNFSYDENWFLKDSYTYNPSLAKMSIGLALASFDNSDNYDVNDKSGNKNVKKLYEDLGFSSSSYYSTGYDKEDNENVGLSINYKTFVTDKDEKVNLVTISLRSGGYGNGGWRNNFNLGEGKEDIKEVDNTSYHLGFYNASTFALSEINNYIAKNNISLDNTKFWISGYSRGAAIANIVSIILGDTISRDNLYTYGVATPQYAVNVTYDNKFNNIFNIINPGDLVPMIPATKWGFTRLGTTIDLPSITDTNRKIFEENMLNIGGIEYVGEDDYSAIGEALIIELVKIFDT